MHPIPLTVPPGPPGRLPFTLHALRRAHLAALALCAFLTPLWTAPAPAPARPGPPGGANTPAQQVQLPYVLRDSVGDTWDVQQDGRIGDGGNNIYDGGGKLFIGAGNEQWASPQPTASFDAARNEVTLAPSQIGGLIVSRRLSVNASQNWCRWVEVLENPGAAPVHTTVHVNFDLGGQLANSKNFVDEKKGGKQFGVATFDGAHNLAMIAAGRGPGAAIKAAPRITYLPNNDQVDFFWDVDVPPRRKVAILHVQAVRPNFNDVCAFPDSVRDKELTADLAPDVARALVNFPHAEKLVNDLEVLRGGMLDVVELRGGDQWRGTLKESSYKIDSFCGPIELPADQVVSMMTVGLFRPSQLFVTADGEVFGGVLRADSIKLQLTSGQVTSIPLHSVTRLGYRKRPGEPEEWKFDKPTAYLRDGQRIGVQPPADPVPVATIYGPLELRPESIAALVFQGEDQPVHQVLLADGSRFAGLVGKDSFDLKIRNPAVGTAPSSHAGPSVPKSVSFPTAGLARLQFHAAPEGPGEETPTLAATNGDVLVGTLGGQLELQTAFDTIRINGAEVRGLRHADPTAAPAGDTGVAGAPAAASPTEVQVTLWDDATLSGRLKGDSLPFSLRCGTQVKVPVALIERYSQPDPQPPAEMLERLKAVVAELGSPDWKRRDRAAEQLRGLGPSAASTLKSLKPAQGPEAQKQIDAILKDLEEARRAMEARKNPPPVPANAPVPPDGAVEADLPQPVPQPAPAPAPPPPPVPAPAPE